MNERILELAEQAGFRVFRAQGLKESVPPDVFAGDGHILINTEIKKFAELIVGECLDIVANADMTELEGPDPEDVLYVACKQIKAHFGVEE